MSEDTAVDSQKGLKRVQLDMSPKALADLNWLKMEVEATSYAEVIRRAVKFVREILTRKKSGAKFFIQNVNGSITEIIF